jgi:ferredoxin
MAKLRIDNREIDAPEGATILEAATEAGIEIPTLCHFPGKKAQTSCLVCVVKVNGSPRLLPACATKVAEGMVVESSSDEVRTARRTALELILGEHLGDCVGPCVSVCPAHMDIPAMLGLVAEGKLREAVAKVKERIPLPAVLGRTCPDLCERGCRRTPHDGAVSICLVKRFVGDADLASDDPYLPEKAPASGKKVAILGAGPAGLSAAWYLLQDGHAVDIYDDHDKPGGDLRYGSDRELLDEEVVDAEAGLILKLGAVFHGGKKLGQDLVLEKLATDYDAVLLTCGQLDAERAKELGVPFAKRGVKVNDKTYQTERPNVFAAGSAVSPLKHDVHAVGSGRVVADAIRLFLAGKPIELEEKPWSVHAGNVKGEALEAFLKFASKAKRADVQKKDGLSLEQAKSEGERCLQCACHEPSDCRLRRYASEYGAVPGRYRGKRDIYKRDGSHPEISYEPGKCIKCGLCVQIAAEMKEELGLSFIGRGFNVKVAVPFNEALRDGLKQAARACAAACPTKALTPKVGPP